MVKLYSLTVLYKVDSNKANTLKAVYELSSFGFFQRNSVLEFMKFTSQIVTQRSQPATRSSVREQEYMCHVYVRGDNLAGVLISDHEYPNRVAHTVLTKVLDEFATKVPEVSWASGSGENYSIAELQNYLDKFQNPQQADAMSKIQNDLDETKIILHNTIEAVLQRGEKLDDLVAKSDELSLQSKAFYKTVCKENKFLLSSELISNGC
ncbi:Synaptobrevin YKT6 [Nymphon striatum]|nr:Synaptobrevin YKT6 [Nymphon striatum]